MHDNLDETSRQEALEFSQDIEVLTENGSFGRVKQITTIAVREEKIVEVIQAFSLKHKKQRGLVLNIPRSMGHVKWCGAISHKPNIIPVHNISRVVIMSDGISDMMISRETFLEKATQNDWDAQRIGKLYADRWYQEWTMLWQGKKYEKDNSGNPYRVAIKGSSKHLADDMTLICADFL